jgi:hypothetical protein
MYSRAEEFGGGLFSLAVGVMTDLVHHEPQSFRQLQAAGLPDAFLAAIKVRADGSCWVCMAGVRVAQALCCCKHAAARHAHAPRPLGQHARAHMLCRLACCRLGTPWCPFLVRWWRCA